MQPNGYHIHHYRLLGKGNGRQEKAKEKVASIGPLWPRMRLVEKMSPALHGDCDSGRMQGPTLRIPTSKVGAL